MIDQILIQNGTGTIAPNNSVDPTDVEDGVIEAFPFDDGGSLDLSSGSIGDEDIYFVLGRDGEYPLDTPQIPAGSIEDVRKETFTSPQAQIVTIDVPDSAEDGTMGLKLSYLGDGGKPSKRESFDYYAQSTDTDDKIIAELAKAINADENAWIYGGSDRTNVITLSLSSGTLEVEVDGVAYTEAFDTDIDTTGQNFVSSHQETIRDRHGVWVTFDTSTDELTFEDRYTGEEPTVEEVGSDETNSFSETLADVLRLESEDPGIYKTFQLALFGQDGMIDASTTQTQDPLEGVGSPDQIREIEDHLRSQTFGRVAWDNNILGSQDEVPKFVDSSEEYDVYVITFKNDNDDDVVGQMEFQQIMFAVATGVTTTNFDSYLGV